MTKSEQSGADTRLVSWRIRASSSALHRRLSLVCLVWLGLAVISARAAAQPSVVPTAAVQKSEPSAEQLARARMLFQKGVELAKHGDFSAAELRFRDALAIHQAPAVEYNLAAALFELRKYDEAFNRSQSVQRDPNTPAALRERADALARALYPYVARLTVMASSPSNDLSVSVDGEPLPAAMWGVPRAMPAGAHVVLAQRADATVSERKVDVPLRTAAIVDVSLVVSEHTIEVPLVQAPPAAEPVPSQARDDRQSRRSKRLWLWGGIALGVVAAGVAVGVGVALAKDEPSSPGAVAGDFQPGVLTWR